MDFGNGTEGRPRMLNVEPLDSGLSLRAFDREHVTFADESERIEDMAIECPVSP
jgi:hypothetical protein